MGVNVRAIRGRRRELASVTEITLPTRKLLQDAVKYKVSDLAIVAKPERRIYLKSTTWIFVKVTLMGRSLLNTFGICRRMALRSETWSK